MDILLYPFVSKRISIWIQKDIHLDPKGYPFGSAARISGWVPALHSGNRAFSYACHCHHVFLSLLAKQGLQHWLYRARSGGARPAAAAPGPPQRRYQARSGGAPASIERLDLAGTWKRGRWGREGGGERPALGVHGRGGDVIGGGLR